MTDDMGAAIETRHRTAFCGHPHPAVRRAEEVQAQDRATPTSSASRIVIFLGEDEINAGVVAVKDMESGEQVKVSLDEAVKLIHDGLAKKNAGKVICDK